MRASSALTRQLMLVTVIAVIAGCSDPTTDQPDAFDWAGMLFADIENLMIMESDEHMVVFEFRGDASEMAGVIEDRLEASERFTLHEQLMITGESDDGAVQVVWTPSNPDESVGLGDGNWKVEASLTDENHDMGSGS